jgi:Fe-S-cluster containining protein
VSSYPDTVLPVLDATPCATCRGDCCVGRPVSLTAFDLNRLCDRLGVPWPELAVAGVAFSGGFRLDSTQSRWNFRLRQRPSGACILAVGETYLRCAVHPSRPAACRIYPYYVGLREEGVRVGLGNNAACPPSLGLGWAERARTASLDAEVAEHQRYQSLVEAWEAQLAKKHELDEFLTFARTWA